ncbi:phosphate/phosphite/phosphonate ABC transporter substrate-binding protein [Corynebacterium sp. A21]|uniref:phosphate/phosphite/phosphonate ABC transporter substrate-binding protein n=1 Tax=Corynebacterium sp. A21 TaxID=3457318 RepID=UPI003FCFB0B6
MFISPKKNAHRIALAAMSVGALFALTACGQSAVSSEASSDSEGSDTLVFAAAPGEDSTAISDDFSVIIEVLEKELGVDVEFQQVTSYAALIEAQAAGQVDIGSYGPFSYVSAVDSGVDVTAVATSADSATDRASYQSFGIVPADSDITDIAGFKDKTVCFVDPTSTSGYLYPSAGLLEAGIDPENDVEPVYAGGHDASAISVASNSCDAGFAHDGVMGSLIEDGTLQEGDLEVVWESEGIVSAPVAVHNQLGEEKVAQIKEIFTTMINKEALVENGYCTSEDDCSLPQDRWGYIDVEDSSYDGVRRVCEVTQAEACAA